MLPKTTEEFAARYLAAFTEYPNLQYRLRKVLISLPDEIQRDFAEDATFEVRLEDYVPGHGTKMFMPLPSSGGHVSRCVVLRSKLNSAPEAFACYIIAHEFAHAYLRNGGWGAIQDKEEAADALASSWGYDRP